jgi:glyoxalase superfamily protein
MGLNVQIVVDCSDPDFLAGFWAAALGYEKQWSWDEATTQDMLKGGLEPDRVNSRCAVIDPAGRGMRIFFQRVPERKQIKNRLHLDLEVGEERVEAMVEKLTALGATKIRDVEDNFGPFPTEHWIVMQDPEGNEFCVVA